MVAHRAPLRLLAAGLLAAAVLAGCGDDGGDRLDHSELVQQANAACKTAETKIAQIPAPKDEAGLATYAARMASATGELHEAIDGLDADETTDQQALDAYAAGLARANTALATMGQAAKRGDAGRVRAQAALIEKLSVGVLAARAGLSVCATATTPRSTS